MGKKSKQKKGSVADLGPQGEPIAEFRFSEPLFQVVLHPTKPLLLSGLATGHIYCYSYDAELLQEIARKNKEKQQELVKEKTDTKTWTVFDALDQKLDDNSPIKTLWKTKRHKGSVRCMCLDPDGEFFYSIGTDNILKKAYTETGKVAAKISLTGQKSNCTKMIKSISHPYLLLGDEDGNVVILNSDTLKTTNTIKKIHGGDTINDIFHFAKRSAHKYISLGQTTMAYWDSRESNEDDFKIPDDDENAKRKVLLSDNQEDEMLCGTFVDSEVGDTVVCGMGEGILTVWKPKINDLEDQVNRIKVCQNESIDCIVPTLQDDNCVWCGCSNGKIYKADVKRGRVVEIREHSDLDEVAFIDLDYGYRVVSGGMEKVILWQAFEEDHDDNTDGVVPKDSSSAESSDFELPESDEAEAAGDNDSDVWDKLDNAESSDGESSDGESSDVDPKGLLSRDELIAELDKDLLSEDSAEKDQKANRIGDKEKRTNKKRKISAKQPSSHGITKFDNL